MLQRFPRFVLSHLFSFGILLVVLCIVTFPAIFNLTNQAIGDGGDNLQFLGWQQIVVDNAIHGRWLFADSTQWRYPDGFEFGRNVDGYLFLLLGAGLNTIFDPVLSFNLSVISLLFLNLLLSYLIFYDWSKSRASSLVASIIFGASFYSLARNGSHPNLMFTVGFLAVFWSLHKLATSKKDSKQTIVLLATSVLLTALSSYQYLVMLGISLALLLPLTGLFFRKNLLVALENVWNHKTWFFGTLVLFSSVMLIFGGFNYLQALLTGSFVAKHSTYEEYWWWSPSLWEFVRPHQYLKLWYSKFFSPVASTSIDYVVFLGFAELILVAVAVVKNWRSRLNWFVCTATLIFFILSMGGYNRDFNVGLPYTYLMMHFPFSAVAETGRWIVLVVTGMSILLAISLAKIKSRSFRVNLCFAMIIVLVIERFPGNFYLSAVPNFTELPYLQVVRTQKSSAVLDLPIDLTPSPYGNWLNTLPSYYGKPILNGYLHWSADTAETRNFLQTSTLYRFACESKDPLNLKYFDKSEHESLSQEEKNKLLVQQLKAEQISTVVVHKNSYLYFPYCEQVLSQIDTLLPKSYIIDKEGTNLKLETRRYTQAAARYYLLFPQDGIFTVRSIHYSDSFASSLVTWTLNNQLVVMAWKTIDSEEFNQQTRFLQPHNNEEAFSIEIPAGSIIEFNDPSIVTGQGFFNITYDFKKSGSSSTVMPIIDSSFEKVYDDATHEVYRLRQ